MEFQKERVFTALNADELKPGSKVICANCLANLKEYVADYFNEGVDNTSIIASILDETHGSRFQSDLCNYPLAYLVSKHEESWIVYLNRTNYYLTSCRSDRWKSVKEDYGAKTKLFEGTEDESENWYISRGQFTDIIAAWEDGKTIQYNSGHGWEDCCDNKPAWDITSEYRIKPEGLKWTDLKIGDVIRSKFEDGYRFAMVIIIDTYPTMKHIGLGDKWLTDKELEKWEKVE